MKKEYYMTVLPSSFLLSGHALGYKQIKINLFHTIKQYYMKVLLRNF